MGLAGGGLGGGGKGELGIHSTGPFLPGIYGSNMKNPLTGMIISIDCCLIENGGLTQIDSVHLGRRNWQHMDFRTIEYPENHETVITNNHRTIL